MNLLGVAIFSSAMFSLSGMLLQQSAAPAASLPPGVKVLIDNQHAVICDVTFTKGTSWPMERYDEDTLVVPLSKITLKATPANGKPETVNLEPGAVKFWPKGTQQALSPDTDGHAIVAHFKDAKAARYENTSGFGPAFPRPRVKKIFENDRIVTWDYTWVKGERTPNHFHDKDVVIVYLAPGLLQSVTPDGKSTPNEFKAGEARFNVGNRAHYEEYVRGDGPRAIITELKQ